MVRDKDLSRWGRASAVVMIFVGFFSLGGGLYLNHLIENEMVPSLASIRSREEKLISQISHEKLRDHFLQKLEFNRLMDQSWFRIVRAFQIAFLFICVPFLSFYTAVLSWRSYELASVVIKSQAASGDPNEPSAAGNNC
jgi:hypothetical protein